jgi:hypothetical protein
MGTFTRTTIEKSLSGILKEWRATWARWKTLLLRGTGFPSDYSDPAKNGLYF